MCGMKCVGARRTNWKQLRTEGSMLEPPKEATSPSCRGIWMESWSRRPRRRWSQKPVPLATCLNKTGGQGEAHGWGRVFYVGPMSSTNGAAQLKTFLTLCLSPSLVMWEVWSNEAAQIELLFCCKWKSNLNFKWKTKRNHQQKCKNLSCGWSTSVSTSVTLSRNESTCCPSNRDSHHIRSVACGCTAPPESHENYNHTHSPAMFTFN